MWLCPFGRRVSLLPQAPITVRQDRHPANRHWHLRGVGPQVPTAGAPPTEAKIWERLRGRGDTDVSGEPTAEAGGGTGQVCMITRKPLRVLAAVIEGCNVNNVDCIIVCCVGFPDTPRINPIYNCRSTGLHSSTPCRRLKKPTYAPYYPRRRFVGLLPASNACSSARLPVALFQKPI